MGVSGAATLAVCAYLTWTRGGLFDDALIYSRYVDNALAGRGLVFNPGERVNAMTSPLYSYLLLALSGLFGDVLRVQRVFHAVALAGACWLLGLLVGRRAPLAVAAWTPLLAATCYYFYTMAGLETPLFLALLLLAVWLHEVRRTGWLAVVSAMLLLTRGESVFLVLGLIAGHFIERRPLPPWRILIAPALLLAAHYSFNGGYYGEMFPSTLMAKVQHGQSGIHGGLAFLRPLARSYPIVLGNNAILVLLVSALAIAGAAFHRRDRLVWILAGYSLALGGFYLALRVSGYHWYFAPFYLVLYVYVALGVAAAGRAVRWKTPRQAALAVAAAALVVGGLQFDASMRSPVVDAERRDGYTAVGNWVRLNTPPDSSLACSEIGFLGFYSQRRIVDMLGLVTPDVAAALARGRLDSWIDGHQPDFVLIHDPPRPLERTILPREEQGDYAPVEAFPVPGYRLLQRVGGW